MYIVKDKKWRIEPSAYLHQLNHINTNRVYKSHKDVLDYISKTDDKSMDLRYVKKDSNNYLINVYKDLSDGEFNPDAFTMEIDDKQYSLIPYTEVDGNIDIGEILLEDTVDNYIDGYCVLSNNKEYDENPSVDNPVDIDRINHITIETNGDNDSDSKSISITSGMSEYEYLDRLIVDLNNMMATLVSNSKYIMLSGGFDWRYDPSLFVYKTETIDIDGNEKSITVPEYCVLFTVIDNIDLDGYVISSHFTRTDYNTLISNKTRGDYISLAPLNSKEAGIWIKISAEYLDKIHTDEEFSVHMKRWGYHYDINEWYVLEDANISSNNMGDNNDSIYNDDERDYSLDFKKFLSYKMSKGLDPIYIQYKLKNPTHRDINLFNDDDKMADPYRVKSYYNSTNFNIKANEKNDKDNLRFAVFYKSLTIGGE